MVDLTPRALLNRLQRGVVYAPDKAMQARQNFFKEPALVALRELALRRTAHEVEIRQSREQEPSNDRILIHITADSSTAALIRRARRVADYLHAECYAVCVDHPGDREAREAIERHLNLARHLHIEARMIPGKDTAVALVAFARAHRITQIFLARPQQRGRLSLGRSLAQQVVRLARNASDRGRQPQAAGVAANRYLASRCMVRVVLWPGTKSTSSNSPPQPATRFAPTTWSGR